MKVLHLLFVRSSARNGTAGLAMAGRLADYGETKKTENESLGNLISNFLGRFINNCRPETLS